MLSCVSWACVGALRSVIPSVAECIWSLCYYNERSRVGIKVTTVIHPELTQIGNTACKRSLLAMLIYLIEHLNIGMTSGALSQRRSRSCLHPRKDLSLHLCRGPEKDGLTSPVFSVSNLSSEGQMEFTTGRCNLLPASDQDRIVRILALVLSLSGFSLPFHFLLPSQQHL